MHQCLWVLVARAFHSVLSFFLKARIREIEDAIVGDPFSTLGTMGLKTITLAIRLSMLGDSGSAVGRVFVFGPACPLH